MNWSPFDVVPVKATAKSNKAKSQQYRAALDSVLKTCNPAEVPAYNGRFSRQWFADRIGCSPVTLTTSPQLRTALSRWEKTNLAKMRCTSPRFEDDETNVVEFVQPRSGGLIFPISVTISKARGQQSKDVPTLVWLDGMDDWVSDYARFLIFSSKRAYSSVEETIKKLRLFRRFQRKFDVPYDKVNDDFLVAWQGEMAAKSNSTVKRQNECVSAVHDFFKWAQSQGLLVNHVQIAPKQDYSGLRADYVFPISSEEAVVVGRFGQTHTKWVSTLTGGSQESNYGKRNTPTSKQTIRLGEVIEAHTRNAVRNKLMMDWALFTGARVSEILQIKEHHLPPFENIQAFFDDDGKHKLFEIWIERKNRGKACLRVPGDLALRTAEYIAEDAERLKIIETQHGGVRANDSFTFLSEKGGVLSADSVTRIFGNFFREAGITKANIHRLRAKYITEVIEFQLDRFADSGVNVDPTSNWTETILITATQVMGHSSPISLVPYLNEILQKRATSDGRMEARPIEAQERSLKDLLHRLESSLRSHSDLAQAMKLMNAGRFIEARDIIGDIFEQLNELANV
ncbi:tyrosine-type recombinase/integrase [Rhizobium leguminosarum]